MVNGRAKGAGFERCTSNGYSKGGIKCRRGCQHSAVARDGSRHPDIIFEEEDVDLYAECKCRKSGATYLFDWVEQAKEEAPTGTTTVVIYKINNRPPVAVMDFEEHVEREKMVLDLRRENQALKEELKKL